jgi:hypothetical protein
MCKDAFVSVYRLVVARRNQSNRFLDQQLDVNELRPSEDDLRNQSAAYRRLFDADCRSTVEDFLNRCILEMKGRPFIECSDIIAGASYLQEMVAGAMWRFGCQVGPLLEDFAREYDRIDHPEVQRRLHERAQSTD